MSEHEDGEQPAEAPQPTPNKGGGARGRAGKGATAGSWSKGQSGNSSGRPRGFAGVSAFVLGETQDGKELAQWMIDIWRDKSRPHVERERAHQWLSDRGLGRPVTTVDLQVTAGDGVQRDWSAMPLQERLELLERIRAVPRLGGGEESSDTDKP